MQTIPRALDIKLPNGQSAFLWGPRKTGKTTFLRTAFPGSIVYNLLQTDLFRAFLKEYRPAKALVVCNEQRSRLNEGILIAPWREFFAMLWNGAVVS